MELGIGSYTWPLAVTQARIHGWQMKCAIDLVNYAAANDVHYVQFCDNLPLHAFHTAELEDIRAIAQQKQVAVQVGFRKLTKENVLQYLSLATFFSSPFIRTVIDDTDYQPNADSITSLINEVLPLLEQSNTILAIENHDRFPACTLKHIITSTSERYVGICLDTANSLGAGEGVKEVMEVLAPFAVNLHVKDVTIRRIPNKMGFTVKGSPAGSGDLDIPWLLHTLAKHDRCATASLELWSEEDDDETAAVRKEKQWSDESLQYLKRIIS